MAKFNTTSTRSAKGQGPIVAEPSGTTFEGGQGYARDAKSDLFLLAVANMVGEDTFYEKVDVRAARFRDLVHQVAVSDPEWMVPFLRWLRVDGNMRSASLVAAAEFVHARLAAKLPSVASYEVPGLSTDRGLERTAIDSVLQRADEPGELLAYWTATYGRAIPKPVKRGIGDAVRRLYSEFSLLKYDTASKGFRFADVLDLCHPSPATPDQGFLFRYALDRRHNRDGADNPASARWLPMVTANYHFRQSIAYGNVALFTDPDLLKAAGMTWEDALSLAGPHVDKRKLWEALIPSMGYMALLRNLRNFDEAGVPDEVAEQVAARLADPGQVARSRQFPFRFLSAYENVASDRWRHPLGKALNACLTNVPQLPGRTLILIDTSASMTNTTLSAKSTVTPAKAAAVFGIALGVRCNADVYGFADGVFRHQVDPAKSVLRQVELFLRRTGEVGHGTRIVEAARATFAGHDRVFVISDMQTFVADCGAGTTVTSVIPRSVPMYGFNLGGYKPAAFDAGSTNRVEFGGLTDATFRMVPLIEAGRNCDWGTVFGI